MLGPGNVEEPILSNVRKQYVRLDASLLRRQGRTGPRRGPVRVRQQRLRPGCTVRTGIRTRGAFKT